MTVHIAIPAYRERDWLPLTLQDLAIQDDRDFQVWVCVNQPRHYQNSPEFAATHRENEALLQWLERETLPFKLHVLDAIHGDRAPRPQEAGVGWARRHLFEQILAREKTALCLSLDADTRVPPHYVATVREAFRRYPNAVALALPYYHRIPEDTRKALHLLRYELYMRHYQINLWRISSPYAYLPLGSAIAFRGKAYRAVGGMPPRDAGEDFYFLQRLRKNGPVMRWVDVTVEPSARASKRVPFGTGPLIAQNNLSLQDARYPFFKLEAFDLLAQTFASFPHLYKEDLTLPAAPWLTRQLCEPASWQKMRRNVSGQSHFIKACHERIDGLRTLQYLRRFHEAHPGGSEQLQALLVREGEPSEVPPFETSQLEALAALRDRLFQIESGYQKRFMENWDFEARW